MAFALASTVARLPSVRTVGLVGRRRTLGVWWSTVEIYAGALDRSDAETLFATHGAWLLGSLRQQYGADLAEDLLQDTYLKVLRQQRPAEILKPKAFPLQVARNLFLSRYRRDRRREELDAWQSPLFSQAAAQDTSLLLQDIVLSLPQPLREVFLLSRFGGMTNQEISHHLGIRLKTVEWRMTKALAQCAAQLRD